MKTLAFLALSSCFIIGSAAVYGETFDIPKNQMDDSSYPSSNALDASPNIPDPVHGTPRESYQAPDSNMPSLKKTTVYNPYAPSKPGDTRPAVPGNSDVIDSPNSDNSGVVIPDGGEGGAGARR